MRKLFCLLSTVLLLFGCNDVDEFGLMLPDSVTLDEVRPISELTYEELDSLVDDAYLREEMRFYGGLLVRMQGYGYNSGHVELFYSDNQTYLPPQYGIATDFSGSTSGYEDGTGKIVYYLNWTYNDLQSLLPGKTIYCKAAYFAYGYNGLPGFKDEIVGDDNSTIFSDIYSYTFPDMPLISAFEVNGGSIINAYFRLYGYENLEAFDRGICYSSTNQLPTVDADEVVYDSPNDDYWIHLGFAPAEPGTYYVRAFVRSRTGEVSYSPVRSVVCDVVVASARIDSILNVAEIGYDELTSVLPVSDEGLLNSLRGEAGVLLFVSSEIRGSYDDANIGMSISNAAGEPAYVSAETIYDVGSSEDRKTIYWQRGNDFLIEDSYCYNAGLQILDEGYYYEVYSDTVTYTMKTPIVNIFSIEPIDDTSFNVNWNGYWGENMVATLGVCYSEVNDLPTVQDEVLSQGDNAHIFVSDTPLATGSYYVRFFVQTEEGIGYSPVQRITITEDMTTR